jgi:hypothetical protein
MSWWSDGRLVGWIFAPGCLGGRWSGSSFHKGKGNAISGPSLYGCRNCMVTGLEIGTCIIRFATTQSVWSSLFRTILILCIPIKRDRANASSARVRHRHHRQARRRRTIDKNHRSVRQARHKHPRWRAHQLQGSDAASASRQRPPPAGHGIARWRCQKDPPEHYR